MKDPVYSHPLDRRQVVDRWFLEHRAKLIDIAAWLDRLDRARPTGDGVDFREAAFLNAISVLTDGQPERAKRILLLLSDHSSELAQSAEGMKGASGAPTRTTVADAGSAGDA